METPDEKLKDLMKILAEAISHVFSGSEDIRQTLSMIEKEGYHVDLILASVTKVTKIEEGRLSNMADMADTDMNDFDRSFLRNIHIRIEEEA